MRLKTTLILPEKLCFFTCSKVPDTAGRHNIPQVCAARGSGGVSLGEANSCHDSTTNATNK